MQMCILFPPETSLKKLHFNANINIPRESYFRNKDFVFLLQAILSKFPKLFSPLGVGALGHDLERLIGSYDLWPHTFLNL